MKSSLRRTPAVLLILLGVLSGPLLRPDAALATSDLVISQVYGGGGNSGAVYRNDFIEVFNRGTTTLSLAGMSVQYASSAGTTWQVTALSGNLAPGQHYLIQEAQGAGGTTNLPTPDATGAISMSSVAGKVALVNSAVALSGSCPLGPSVLDFVGFGSANCFEGGAATPAPSNTNAAIRNSGGCADTDVNSADFSVAAANPRNTASPLNSCSAPTTTNPSGACAANPNTLPAGDPTLLTVAVTPGTGPTSTGLSVAADLSAIGGGASQTFFDNGTNGDVTAGDLVFSFATVVAINTTTGAKTLPAAITDAEGRFGTCNIQLTVVAATPTFKRSWGRMKTIYR